jgi:AraC-like DNA-binding protein
MLKYETYQPCNELSHLIDLIEVVEVPEKYTPLKIRFLPDERNYLIFNYGCPFHYKLCGLEKQYKNRLFISGITSHFAIGSISGFSGFIAFRFTPCGFKRVISKKASLIANKLVKIEDVIDYQIDNIEEDLLSNNCNIWRIRTIENLILKWPVKPSNACDEKFSRILEALLILHGKIKIHKLAEQFQLSYTYLERLFKEYLGISPKMYCKLLNLKHILEVGKAYQGKRFTELTYSNGYFDQSHFIKDFKRFTGLNPRKHLKAKKFFGSSFILEE